MSIAPLPLTPQTLVLSGGRFFADMSADDFFEFCQHNRDLRIERTREGNLIIMSPAGSESGRRNSRITAQLQAWSDQDGTGVAFDSSAGFTLPKGSMRSPDASWVRLEKWEALTVNQRKKFAPLVPDFVLELRSEADRLNDLHEKMEEYADEGAALGWLIDPLQRRVEIYRPGQKPVIIESPSHVNGDPEMPGFTLDLTRIW